MPTKMMFGRKFDARPDRIDFRDLPYRARLKSLPNQCPSAQDIKINFPAYRAGQMVLNQGNEGSCTGFGLAAVVNYLRWELWLERQPRGKKRIRRLLSPKVSAQMLYQNARLYDEWKGEDYEGSSCRGAMKGLHKHGVCTEKYWPNFDGKKPGRAKPGRAKPGWDEEAPLTPLGAYYRIDGRSIVDMQSAIFETHAIYVSADVHSGWDRVKKSRTLEGATILPPPPKDKEVGGHAFALVGYTETGFIVQNSWGPDWGFHGFALLPYDDWAKHGTDAWALALGAPMLATILVAGAKPGSKQRAAPFKSPSARTAISLDERLRVREPLRAGAANDASVVKTWVNGEESSHIIFIGHEGRAERELVAAQDGDDTVRIVVEVGIKAAFAKGMTKIAIYDHGGLNSRNDGIKRAQIMGPWFEANGIYPIFVVWQTGFFESAGDIIKLAADKVGVAPERVEGWLIDKLTEVKDRAFEVIARDTGVKAIWQNMKDRAEAASASGGGLSVAAARLKSVIDSLNGKPEIHLLGHSAGAIMQGYFLAALKANSLTVRTSHLWAPACTVAFASATYGPAFGNGVLDPRSTFIELLTDENEERYGCVPVAYSMSLLYLVSRALEADHKMPILGMQKIWKNWQDKKAFDPNHATDLDNWAGVSGSVKLRLIDTEKVPTAQEPPNSTDMINADHGSFDNNIEAVNRALTNILGKSPPVPVTDLRGF